MRALARAVRRAALPVRLTEGFNPRPRIVFPVALEVGVASLDEVAEIELTQCLAPPDIHSRLSSVFPPGLILTAVTALPLRRTGQIPVRIRYRIHLAEAEMAVTQEAAEKLLQTAELPFARQRENRIQNVDLRPALLDLKLEPQGDLLLDVRPSQRGSARPLEVLSLLTNLPMESLRRVRVTKLLMELESQTPDVTSETSETVEPSSTEPTTLE